jgi:predicted aconitase with swiveling domain
MLKTDNAAASCNQGMLTCHVLLVASARGSTVGFSVLFLIYTLLDVREKLPSIEY